MGKTVIIAEKPSVALGVAKVVGAGRSCRDKANGYMEGNGYSVTWAFGHLVGLDSPEAMGYTDKQVPMFPETWKTHVIESAKPDMTRTVRKQMDVIDSLFSGASEIIVATDAGREGELIFRYIYEYLGCRTQFRRLWISSLTDEAIRKGLSELRPGREYDNLSAAAHARSEADWLVGFNASRALRLVSGFKGKLSLGRVQTPVLCMVCERFEANRTFVPKPYWQISAIVHKDMTNVTVLSQKRFDNEKEAKETMERIRGADRMTVTGVEKKKVTTRPPLLYDLTTLQRDANRRFGMTADETLRTAQSLYEKKYLSYPRTGSRYISDDVFATIPGLIAKAAGCERFSQAAEALRGARLSRRSVDASKVTDHHALLPTEVFPRDLTGDEKKIWEMVCGRMLEVFGEDSVSERTTVTLDCSGTAFGVSGSVPVKAGWKAVFGKEAENEGKDDDKEGEDSQTRLPAFQEGETVPAAKFETVRKTDKPLPIYTDASLLGEMETCGRKIDDEELRESMKDIGLGTPATRAAIIETLIARKYIERKDKKLIPTELGNTIWKTVRGRKIADVRTTGEWERELSLIEQGKKDKSEFDRAIRDYVLEIIEDLRSNCKPFGTISTTGHEAPLCPICGKRMKSLQYSVLCDEGDGGCGFRIPKEIAGKKIPDSALAALAAGKNTAVLKGFKSKSGKSFDARLGVDKENKKIMFVFDEPKPTRLEGRICPCCGGNLSDDRWKLACGCGFLMYKSPGGVALTEKQIDRLLSGWGVPLKGLKSKTGKTFSATLKINTSEKKVEYLFNK